MNYGWLTGTSCRAVNFDDSAVIAQGGIQQSNGDIDWEKFEGAHTAQEKASQRNWERFSVSIRSLLVISTLSTYVGFDSIPMQSI